MDVRRFMVCRGHTLQSEEKHKMRGGNSTEANRLIFGATVLLAILPIWLLIRFHVFVLTDVETNPINPGQWTIALVLYASTVLTLNLGLHWGTRKFRK
jgi:hypothetical protein